MSMRFKASDDRGFSLVEMMVVVMVISVLVGVAIPTFAGARSRAQDLAVKAELTDALEAALIFYDDYEAFPNERRQMDEFAAIEPGLTVSGRRNAADADTIEMVTQNIARRYDPRINQTVTLLTQSGSGTWFCIATYRGDDPRAGTVYRGSDTRENRVDTINDCRNRERRGQTW